MSTLLTPKQERFCLYFINSDNATQAAIDAGYSVKTAQSIASENLTKPVIRERIKELREATTSVRVMPVQERKERLSEIARARLTDYVTDQGIKIDKDSPNTAALSGIKTKIKYSRKGREPEIVTDIDLHDPAKAIDLLNKMDKIYTEEERKPVEIVETFVFVLPDGTRVAPASLALPNLHSATDE